MVIYLILLFTLYFFAQWFMSSKWDHEYALMISLCLIMIGFTTVAVLWSNIFQNMYQIKYIHGLFYTAVGIAWIFIFPAVAIYRSIHDSNVAETEYNSKFSANVDSVFNTIKLGQYEPDFNIKDFNFGKCRVLIGNISDTLCTYNYEMTKMLDSSLVAFYVDSADYYVIVSGYETLADGKLYDDGSYAYRHLTIVSFYDPGKKLVMDQFILKGDEPPLRVHKTDSHCGAHISNDSVVHFITEKISG
jgi:hypothetical protein